MNSEQDLAKLRDELPPLWWALYSGGVHVGFTPDQAMLLTQSFVMAMASRSGVFPGHLDNPRPEE